MIRFRGHFPGDPPPAVGAIGTLSRFDVLARDQRQQGHRLGLLVFKIDAFEARQHGQCVVDQNGDELVAGGWVVPRNIGFARLGIVIATQSSNKVRRGRGAAGDATDLRD